MNDKIKELIDSQEPLGEEFEKVLHNNLQELLENVNPEI